MCVIIFISFCCCFGKKKKKKKKKIIIIIIIESNQLDSEVYRRFISMGIIYNIFIYKK